MALLTAYAGAVYEQAAFAGLKSYDASIAVLLLWRVQVR
jgi:hypothetical protein